MAYNIVTNSIVMSEVKKCRYFRVNLGLASTIDKNGNRELNDKDKFSFFYNSQYKTTIYAQGNVGDIKFYVDLFIKEPLMGVYISDEFEEFIIEVDFELIKEKGIDYFLGYILKKVEEEHENKIKLKAEKKIEKKPEGNADLVTINPGAVKYEDLKAFLDKQNKERYKIN
jgi:hypothetical protein